MTVSFNVDINIVKTTKTPARYDNYNKLVAPAGSSRETVAHVNVSRGTDVAAYGAAMALLETLLEAERDEGE